MQKQSSASTWVLLHNSLQGVRFTDQFLLAVMTITINLLGLALPLFALQIYDRIIAKANINTLFVLALGTLAAVAMEGTLRYCRAQLTSFLGARFEYKMLKSAFSNMLSTDLLTLQRTPKTSFLPRFQAIATLREFRSGQAMLALLDLPFVVLYLGLIYYFGHTLAFVPLAILVMFSAYAFRTGMKMRKAIMRRDHHDAQRYQFLMETLSGIHTVKALGAEQRFLRRYERLQQKTSEQNWRYCLLNHMAYSNGQLFAQLMTVSLMVIGAFMTHNEALSVGGLVACVLLGNRLTQPLQRAMGLWTRLHEIELAQAQLLHEKPIPERQLPTQAVLPGNHSLEVRNVSFSYQSNGELLRNCLLHVSAGQAVAISGMSGGGKSTLMKLMAGLYTPQSGEILVSGNQVQDINNEELSDILAYIGPEAHIFQGTIADNLSRFGSVPWSRVQEIVHLMQMENDILRLPQGYKTVLNNSITDPVPPGFKQRMHIARALMSKPKIILFDQADRALDTQGYNALLRLLNLLKGKVSIVMVSEDSNLQHMADTHLRLQNGTLRFADRSQTVSRLEVVPFSEWSLQS